MSEKITIPDNDVKEEVQINEKQEEVKKANRKFSWTTLIAFVTFIILNFTFIFIDEYSEVYVSISTDYITPFNFIYGIAFGVITAIPYAILWCLKVPKELQPNTKHKNVFIAVYTSFTYIYLLSGWVLLLLKPALIWYNWLTAKAIDTVEMTLSVAFFVSIYYARELMQPIIDIHVKHYTDNIKMWKFTLRQLRQDNQIQV